MNKRMEGVDMLAYDAFIARMLGMSYGQYKAITTPEERDKYEARYIKAYQKHRQRAHGGEDIKA